MRYLFTALLIALLSACAPEQVERFEYRGDAVFHVERDSMIPSLFPGDFIVTEKVEFSALQSGDIIAYWSGNGSIVHRIVSVDRIRRTVTTKGDNFARNDPYITHETDIMGRLKTVITQ